MNKYYSRYNIDIFRDTTVKICTVAITAVMLCFSVGVLAETPVSIGTLFPSTSTFTITSAGPTTAGARNQLYVNGSALARETVSSPNTSDDKYLFAFVQYPDNTDNYYLYSVGAKEFVSSVSGSTDANLYNGNSHVSPVYVYMPSTNLAKTRDEQTIYNYAIAFDNASVQFATGSSGYANTDNTVNHILEITDSRVAIVDWNLLGGGGNYSLSIAQAGTFNSEALAAARQQLTTDLNHASIAANGYTKTSFKSAGITANSVVYTLTSEDGATLYATSNGLASSDTVTAANPYARFIFYANGADTLLYSVGLGQFVNSSKSLVAGTSASPLYVYSSGDTHGYSLAFCFDGSSWSGNVIGSTSSAVSNSNRFKVTAVDGATYSSQWLADAYNGVYTLSTLEELGLSPDKVYYLYSDVNSSNLQYAIAGTNSSHQTASVRNQLNWATINLNRSQQPERSDLVNDIGYHFAFVTDNSDANKIYLYSLNAQRAANASGDLVYGSSNLVPIYVYATHNAQYPLALSFSSDGWGVEGSAVVRAGSTKDVSTTDYSTPLNRLHFLEVSDDTYTLASARAILKGWMTTDFHYKGIHDRAFKSNGMQQVAEVNYYYYVNTSRREYNRSNGTPAIDLKLPLMRYLARDADGNVVNRVRNDYSYPTFDNRESAGNNMEPMGYFRWYDYRTDSMPSDNRIQPWNDTNYTATANGNGYNFDNKNILAEKFDKSGKSLGYFGINLDGQRGILGPCASNIGVYYNIPSEANSADWTGDIIACDVSRYTDYRSSASSSITEFIHEPTLSVRYIFHILPATSIANEMKDSLINTGKTMGDKGIFVFGSKDDNATMNVRTNLQSYSQYYFYPMTADALKSHHVYHPTGEAATHGITDGDFDTSTIYQASAAEWRVYNSEMTAYRVIGTTNSLYFNDMAIRIAAGSDANNRVYGLKGSTNDWKDLNGNQSSDNYNDEIGRGHTCYLVGYMTDGTDTHKCPFFNARLDLTATYPKSLDQINSDNDAPRTDSYLSTNYGSPVATFSFDTENSQQNYSAPSGQNADDNLSPEPSPFAQRQYSFVYYKLGDYSNLGYNLSNKTYMPLHGDFSLYKEYGPIHNDRTYVKSNGSQYGYFMFTDASNESRVLGYQDFQGTLCAGSQIIVSAWVNNTSGGAGSSQPELRFELYGITKDAQGNDVSTKLLGSLCSGNFQNNVSGYNYTTGTWYQVYGVVTLPAETNVSQYRNFRISIDNFCNSTNGADYAIDDINVYQSNSRLTVTQKPALCEDDNPNEVKLKIKGNYSIAKNLTSADTEDKTVYYRFYRQNGTAVTGKDFYGEGHDSYGEATVYHEVTDDDTKFETDLNGVQQVILVNDTFSLKADSIYYASVALANPETASSWGRPSDICSFYSSNFSYVRQSVMISGGTSTTMQLRATCDEDSIKNYDPIALVVTAPDQVNGGTTTLSGVKFDYFLGTRQEMNDIKHGSSDLLQALRHYRDHYPTATDGSGNVAAAEGAMAAYTVDDKFLIDSCRYDAATNHTGKLWLSCSNSLSDFPLPVGRLSILAIPVEDHITVTLNNRSYEYDLCDDPSLIVVSVMRNGPGLVLGRDNVSYPGTQAYRSVRIGLPQIKAMGTTGTLRVPIAKRTFGGTSDNVPEETLGFFNDLDTSHPTYLYIVDTNDPTIDRTTNVKFAELVNENLNTAAAGDSTLNIKNITQSLVHEGYWYEIGFYFHRTDIESECPGETYLTLKIVPEYLTWNPTADNTLNSNWNNDQNWTRSTAGELYNAAYRDYRAATYQFTLHKADGTTESKYNTDVDNASKLVASTQPASYVPMYFSKVIIPSLTTQPYPMLGYVRRQDGTGLVMNMTNAKNHAATANIQYDMEAYNIHENTVDSSYWCAPFTANICEQIHFKTGAQLRAQQFLNYKRAWVEMELPINSWGTFTTPMKRTIGGDMYVPKVTGVQTTPLFQDMNFSDVDAVDENGKPWVDETTSGEKYGLFGKPGDGLYNRIRMPVYQKLWGENGNMYTARTNTSGAYSSYDQPYMMLIQPSSDAGYEEWTDMNSGDRMSTANVWSHTFNAVGVPSVSASDENNSPQIRGIYNNAYGTAGKVGDDYATPTTNGGAWAGRYALMRLPKADTSFKMYRIDSEGNMATSPVDFDVTSYRVDNYRLGIPYSNVEGNLGEDSITTASLWPEPAYGYAWNESTNDFEYDEASGNIMFLDKDNNKVSTPTGLVYDLIGNPYTSSISIRDFVNANTSVLRTVERDGRYVYRLWLLNGDTLEEYATDNTNVVVDPGRAFFVPIQVPGRDVIRFTTNMETDPNIRQSASARVQAAPAKVYRLSDLSDVTNIINHGVDTQVYCWSPSAGVLAVSGENIQKVEIYNVSGQLVQRAEMTGAEKQFTTGSGVFVVKATLKDGKAESQKVTVK